MILSGAYNRLPMSDKDLYDSWKSRSELYMKNKQHGRMILELVENGPLTWPTVEENGVTRTKKYVELSAAKKIQVDYDTKETNIILQGLPDDIYSLVNHHRVSKDLWKGGRQGQSYSSIGYKSNATSSGGNNASGQARVVKCYNCQGEGHMARQCTQPKRPRNATWYKDKAMLVEAQEARKYLDAEKLTFLVDSGVPDGQDVQTIILNNAAFQTEDLDTYDSECDDVSNEKAVLMANISNYDFDIVSKVPHFETYLNDMENQSNKRNDRISQTPSRNIKNNVVAQPRKVNKKNHVVEPILDVDVKHSLLNANSIFATCCPDCSLVSRLQMFETHDRESLSAHKLSCALGKSKKSSYRPKAKDTNQEKLYLLHMDLCGSMRVASINGKSSGLVPNLILQQPCIPPQRDDLDHLFQHMFDEYFNPPTIDVSLVPVADVQRVVDLANSYVSTSIDQDAPSISIPSTQDQEHSLNISQGFEKSSKTPHFHDDPLLEPLHKDSTSRVSSSNVRPIYTPFESLGRWTKDHLISNVIGDPSRVVDPILSTWKIGNDFLLVQINVDDIKFASTNTAMCNEFANLMTTMFKMSMMGQMSFFLGLQISQTPRDTPMVEKSKLDKDLHRKPIDATLYCGMIGSPMYLTSSRLDLIYAVFLCAWIPEQVENRIMELYFVWTEYQLANIFTKPLPRERFNFLIEKISMRSMSPETFKHLAEETDE
uniref:CCHC-type domain-containing protein n=1 Tax=Tanacetum cinerariifolium TaxID=118510 RepID=A0A6L2NJU2_TANCI|nr:hypothetical protein [Tanacetum cinerariifolium]